MTKYAQSLDAWLRDTETSEARLATLSDCTQVSINRYRRGMRLPDAELAKRIEVATEGAASYDDWRTAFLEKAGIV